MMKYLIFLIVLFLSSKPSLSDYQLFKLAEQWPASFCLTANCKITPPKDFTLHGLWPTNATTPWPINCSQKPFRYANITSLEPRLNVSWPDLLGNNSKFWGAQWKKHGTCSEKMFDEFNYFKLALDTKDRLNILTVLANEGISPHPTTLYNNTDVVNAIKKHIGQVEPELHCVKAKSSTVLLLKEVRLCLDHDGVAYISCPTTSAPAPVTPCDSSLFKLPL